MLVQILIGSVVMVLTTLIHAGGMAIALRWLLFACAKQSQMTSIWTRAMIVGAFVVILFLTTLLEAGVWALVYSGLGAMSGFEESLYFSTVTYTTLGYGDIVLADEWRLLSSFEAANGIIMFGWTTALIFVAIRRVSKSLPRLGASD